MNSFSLFLAWRYLSNSAYGKKISPMIAICFIGILIGSCSLALILSIVNGFEKETKKKLQGVHAQIIMSSPGQQLNAQQIGAVLHKEFEQEVTAWSPQATQQVIIQNTDSNDVTNVVMLQGIDPETEPLTSTVEKKLIYPAYPQTDLVHATQNNSIIIGKKLAKNFGLTVGDPITLLFTQQEQSRSRKITFEKKETRVGGIIQTGIEEFDSGIVLCSLDFFATLFPDTGITHINLALNPHVNEQTTIQKLLWRFGIDVYSWKDLYPALVSAMKLERYAMFFVLILIALVASMNIISLLFMQITYKHGDIAILKAMGMRSHDVTNIFLLLGGIICSAASLTGLVLAAILGWCIKTYHFIELPDVYYVTHLPIEMELSLFLFVFFVTVALGMFASWISARTTKSINIATILRFEG